LALPTLAGCQFCQVANDECTITVLDSGLEEWQNWRRQSKYPIAAFPAEHSAEMTIKLPIFASKIDEYCEASSGYGGVSNWLTANR